MSGIMKGKVIFITGVSSGLGRSMAKKFFLEGGIVIGFSRRKEILEETKKELNIGISIPEERGIFYPIAGDVGIEKDVEQGVKEVMEKFGKVDILINNAGVGFRSPVESTSIEQFDTMMNTNVRGIFLMTKYILPQMKEKKDGYIVNISSGAGLNGIANLAVYCASKFAVKGFSESVALEAKPHDVRVSVLYPGSMNTNFHENTGSHPDHITRQKMMQPEDIAEIVFTVVNQPKTCWIFDLSLRAFQMGR